jgi:hypothetical protein
MKLGAILIENKGIQQNEKKNKIVRYIVEQIESTKIDDMQSYLNPELIKYICEIIENQVPKRKDNKKDIDIINKMDLFIEVMKKLNTTDEQMIDAKATVEFLLVNKMIKKTSYKKIIWHLVKKYVLSVVFLV